MQSKVQLLQPDCYTGEVFISIFIFELRLAVRQAFHIQIKLTSITLKINHTKKKQCSHPMKVIEQTKRMIIKKCDTINTGHS